MLFARGAVVGEVGSTPSFQATIAKTFPTPYLHRHSHLSAAAGSLNPFLGATL